MNANDAVKYVQERPDLMAIADLIPEGARVLDLGCGNGLFLKYLVETKHIRALGIDISQEAIIQCIDTGVPVIHGDLNEKLDFIKDQSFDYVILSCTLQEMVYPHRLLQEMLRIGRNAIVGVINFGHIRNRFQLLFSVNMPVSKRLPHQWHSTPNIHLGTLKDFKHLCRELDFKILKTIPLSAQNRKEHRLSRLWPNMLAVNCVFMIAKRRKSFEE